MRRTGSAVVRTVQRARPGRATSGSAERGYTTAEYAVGTVAACGLGGVLYKVVTSEQVFHLITDIISKAFHLPF